MALTSEEQSFWDRYKRWLLDDISICIGNEANIGAAKLICASIDAFGSFYLGRGYRNNENFVRPGQGSGVEYERKTSKDAFIIYLKNYIPSLFKQKVAVKIEGEKPSKQNVAEFLYYSFRNSLIHAGLPEIGVSVTKQESDVVVNWTIRKEYFASINIIALNKALIDSISKYDADLYDNHQFERSVRWRDRYKYLHTSGFFKHYIKEIEN